MKEYDLDRYIRYSFKKNFKMNNRDVELFEPCKILGDVFEALIGAIFIDGGIEEVLRVYQHLLGPFVLFVAKYSKKLNKEPKEDFTILAGLHRIKPDIRSRGECEMTHGQLGQLLKETNPEDPSPICRDSKEVDVNMADAEQKEKSIDTFIEDMRADQKVRMIRCEVLFNHNEVMAEGLGSTRKQAERNASINGLAWLRANKLISDE